MSFCEVWAKAYDALATFSELEMWDVLYEQIEAGAIDEADALVMGEDIVEAYCDPILAKYTK